jgi:hypothetical protein
MIATDTLIEIYFNKREHVGYYRQPVFPMAIRLKFWSGLLNKEDLDVFTHCQKWYNKKDVPLDWKGNKLFGSSARKVSAETYTNWIEKFNQLCEHRLEGYK